VTRIRYRGFNRAGLHVTGAAETPDVAAWVESKDEAGWQTLTVVDVDTGVEVGGIGPPTWTRCGANGGRRPAPDRPRAPGGRV
jgi:hypothetical protein